MAILPADYHARIGAVEERHWWHAGMRRISAGLLGDRVRAPGMTLLDAGCGTGGFMRWALEHWAIASVSGVDVSETAIALAAERAPAADLRVAPLHALPFEAGAFDLVVANDVLQHVDESEVDVAVAELARVVRPDGALLVRTNGARRARAARADWRVYDARTLGALLERGGLTCRRITYANMLPSLWAAARGRAPAAPTAEAHGIPPLPGWPAQRVGRLLLDSEARYLRRAGRTLPFGHTLLAVCVPASA